MTLAVGREAPDPSDALAFPARADARSAPLHPAGSRHGLPVAALLASDVLFLARRDGRALGCGGFVPLDEGTAEVKRLFVDPAARGGGVGRAIMSAIEAAARTEGFGSLVPETGAKSVEALGLYRGLGFAECDPFGAYGPDPLGVFVAERLA